MNPSFAVHQLDECSDWWIFFFGGESFSRHFLRESPDFCWISKKQQILYGYFILADVSSSFFSRKLLQILNIFLNRWNPWINPPKTTNLASIHLKSPRLWDISPLCFGFTNIDVARQQRGGSHVRGLRLRRVPRRRWDGRGDGGGAHDVQRRLSDAWGTAGSDGYIYMNGCLGEDTLKHVEKKTEKDG